MEAREVFETARQNTLSQGYGKGIIDKPEFKISYGEIFSREAELMYIGRLEGIEEGIEQGIERGIEQGIEQGISKGLRTAAIKALQAGETVEEILESDENFKLIEETLHDLYPSHFVAQAGERFLTADIYCGETERKTKIAFPITNQEYTNVLKSLDVDGVFNKGEGIVLLNIETNVPCLRKLKDISNMKDLKGFMDNLNSLNQKQILKFNKSFGDLESPTEQDALSLYRELGNKVANLTKPSHKLSI